MTPTAGVDEAQKDNSIPSSGLSAERLEEIDRILTQGVVLASEETALSDLLAEVRRLQGELSAAREETAQAVRDEQDAARAVMASLAIEGRGEGPSAWYEGYVAGQESLAQRAIAALHRRSRSLPGETADA